MTVEELSEKLQYLDRDKVVIFEDPNGGWTNIDIVMDDSSVTVSIVPSSNSPFSDE